MKEDGGDETTESRVVHVTTPQNSGAEESWSGFGGLRWLTQNGPTSIILHPTDNRLCLFR